jgi:hypothetical protein
MAMTSAPKRLHCGAMRSGSRADLKNETGQLIEGVDRLQAQKNQRRDHQIETEMHEGLQPNAFCPARESRKVVNQTQCVLEKLIARRTIRRQLEQKASAAAEVMPSS